MDASSFVVELPTSGSVVIGRDADCDLQIASGSVSRQRARLDMRGERGKLVDLGSRNGTFVNGERLEEGEACDVARGDEVFLGSARFGLIDASLAPAGTQRVLVRSGLLARIDRDLERNAILHALALRLPERWYTHEDVVRWLATLPRDALWPASSGVRRSRVERAGQVGPRPRRLGPPRRNLRAPSRREPRRTTRRCASPRAR